MYVVDPDALIVLAREARTGGVFIDDLIVLLADGLSDSLRTVALLLPLALIILCTFNRWRV